MVDEAEGRAVRAQDEQAAVPVVRRSDTFVADREFVYTDERGKQQAVSVGSTIVPLADVPEGAAPDTPVSVVVTKKGGNVSKMGVMLLGDLQEKIESGEVTRRDLTEEERAATEADSGDMAGETPVESAENEAVNVAEEGADTDVDAQGVENNEVAPAQPQSEAAEGVAENGDKIEKNEILPQGEAGQTAVELYDNQGNPIDENGELVVEQINSIEDLTDEDFENPTRNVQLPPLPENVSDAIGADGKPVVIKKSIFEKNKDIHPEFDPQDSRSILTRALYNPDLAGLTQPKTRPYYRVVIQTGDMNAVVVLDVYENKGNTEIVGWREMNEKGLEKLKRQAEREDGQLLILSPGTPSGSAAALSTLPSDLSSADKGTEVSSENQVRLPVNPVAEKWNALVEDNEGDEAEALDTAMQMVGNKTAELEAARKTVTKGKSEEAISEAKRAKRERISKLETELRFWKDVAAYPEKKRAAEEEAAKLNARLERERKRKESGAVNPNYGLRQTEADGRLGAPLSLREYIIRKIATGRVKFLWGASESGTGGLKEHGGVAKRQMLYTDKAKGQYPEDVAEAMRLDIMDNHPEFGNVDADAILSEIENIAVGEQTPSEMMDEAERLHEWSARFADDADMAEAAQEEAAIEEARAEQARESVEALTNEEYAAVHHAAPRFVGDMFDADGRPKREPSEVERAVARAEAQTDTNPTEGQKAAGNYRMGHVRVNGFDITIENPKGSERSGVDGTGRAWRQTMNNTYGYIRGTEGVDGDHIDVFLSDNPETGDVFVVDQVNPGTGAFDEHKVMMGFDSEEAARQAYLANYEEGWQGLGRITRVSQEGFKKWIESSHRKTKPFAEYKSVNVAENVDEDVQEVGNEMSFDEANERLADIEAEWDEKILDYIYEHYPTQANVSAKTKSEQGLREREAMKQDETLKRLRAEMKAAVDKADKAVMEAYLREEAENNEQVPFQRVDGAATSPRATERQAKAIARQLKKLGLKGRVRIVDGVAELVKEARKSVQKKSAPETALPEYASSFKGTVVSSTDGAKILKNLKSIADEYDKKDEKSIKTFAGDVARALESPDKGMRSQYKTFETKNGNIVTIRLSDHNSKVSNFDGVGEDNVLSIVVSRKPNKGILNDGEAHVVEYFYSDKALRKASGKPLAAIIRSIEQALYSGEYKDTTGLAQVEEVNGQEAIRLQSVFHGSPYDFEAFDFSHMGEGEGAQAYGWGGYVTEVKGIGQTYAEKVSSKKLDHFTYDGENLREVFDNEYYFDETWRNWKRNLLSSKNLDELKSRILNLYFFPTGKNTRERKKAFERQKKELLEAIENGRIQVNENNHLYHVEIPTEQDGNYLRWEDEVSDETRDQVLDRLAQIEDDTIDAGYFAEQIEKYEADYNLDGKALYEILSRFAFRSDKEASEFLSSLGYVGVSYPAEYQSGGRSDGARNYVIFKESDMKITDHIRYEQDGNGEIAGATLPNGDVLLNRGAMRVDTPFHEFAHKLFTYAKDNRAASRLYDAIREYAESAPQEIKDYVRAHYPGLSDEAYLDEVFAWALSRQSEGGLEAFLNGRGLGADAVDARAWYEQVWDLIKDLWEAVRPMVSNLFGKAYVDLSVFDAYERMGTEEKGKALYDLMMGGKALPGTVNGVNPEPIGKNRFGEVYQWKGSFKDAVHFLINKGSGYLQGVFHRNDIGDIDLAWGNDAGGLNHIIKKHIEKHDDFKSIDDAVRVIEDVIKKGQIVPDKIGRVALVHKIYRVTLAEDKEGTWILTAFGPSRHFG